MKTAILFLMFSGMAGLTGCVTIQSNVKSDAVPTHFRRILIVTKLRNAPGSYVQQYARLFPPGYEVCTLALSPLSFDKPDEAIRKQLESCNSEVILTLELVQPGSVGTRNSRYGGRSYGNSYEFNAEMQSVTTGQPFWKAIISSDPANGEQVPPGSIIKRLQQDHIIEGKFPSASVAQVDKL